MIGHMITEEEIMKKMIKCIVLIVCMVGVMLAGCTSEQKKDAMYHTERAIIKLADGSIVSGNVDHVYHTSNGSVCLIIDGVSYEVHLMNCTLIDE